MLMHVQWSVQGGGYRQEQRPQEGERMAQVEVFISVHGARKGVRWPKCGQVSGQGWEGLMAGVFSKKREVKVTIWE